MSEPVLYTFRRCPYAMRARLALAAANIDFEVREVVLRDKPDHMLELSPKGTVPVLWVDDTVIDESIDIMRWALQQSDPENWLGEEAVLAEQLALTSRCESEFKVWLDRYKYNNRQQVYTEEQARNACEEFLQALEGRLQANSEEGFLFGPRSLADAAIAPFVRQFAFVDKAWFDQAPYPALQAWLAEFLDSARFKHVMQKYPQWHREQSRQVFRAS